jgi:hypothetical protein
LNFEERSRARRFTLAGLIRMLVYRPSALGSMRLAMLGKRFEP